MMRWSIVILLTIGGLGACIGAAIATQNQDPNGGSSNQDPNQQIVRIKPSIDQTKTIPMEPQTVPSY
ncbi:MAG: hypothetical protein ACI9SE_003363, partial [Neolewinella sp.]